jgi:two-component system, OmpR family, sensor kinase
LIVQTLRARLTLWYAVALSLILSIFGGLLYGVVRYQLIRHHDGDLRSAAATVARVLSQQEDCSNLLPSQRAELDRVGRVVLFHEMDGEGRVFYRSPNSDSITASLDEIFNTGLDGTRFDTIFRDKRPLRIYSEPYRSSVGRRGVIHVVERLGDVPAPLASLRFALLLMTPLAVLLSAACGYYLARRALAPVDEVTRMAHEIEADCLGRRLPVPAAKDEISRLSGTINEMLARLERSFETMKRFTADASHELRGPLATMRSAIDVALSRPRDAAEYQAVLGSVGEDVERLRSITEDLLMLARADAGHVTIARHPVNLGTVATEVADSLRTIADAADVHLVVQSDALVIVMGDEAWLRQLVFNLLDNAVKFSSMGPAPSEAGRIEVSVSESPDGACLSIADSGPGIPEASLDRIFERFYRVDGARSYQGSRGFGLGLAIVAWITQAHGGSIRAANRPTGGTVFVVTFPKATIGPELARASGAQVVERS